eukprot:gb/GFBE01075176.1/.p1 GENE.gb/GFBE01075176.1/~~gb/GFBE01075176.1/.p1  ORF type:complete len:217 (+),score=47.62 gb/GFBE01075176.1/:1-651(+)
MAQAWPFQAEIGSRHPWRQLTVARRLVQLTFLASLLAPWGRPLSLCFLTPLSRTCRAGCRLEAAQTPRAAEEANAPTPFRASGFADGGYQDRVLAEQAAVELKGFLEAAVDKANLLARLDDIRSWCQEQGAVDMQEVIDELDSLGEDVQLESHEVAKLGTALVETQAAEQQERSKRERATREGMAALAHKFLSGEVSQSTVTQAFESVEQKTDKPK